MRTIDQRSLLPHERTSRTACCEVCGASDVLLERSVTLHRLSRVQYLSHWTCTDQRACKVRYAAKHAQSPPRVARISDLYGE